MYCDVLWCVCKIVKFVWCFVLINVGKYSCRYDVLWCGWFVILLLDDCKGMGCVVGWLVCNGFVGLVFVFGGFGVCFGVGWLYLWFKVEDEVIYYINVGIFWIDIMFYLGWYGEVKVDGLFNV